MSRMLFLAGLLGVGLLSASWAGDDRSKASDTKRVALEDELRVLLNDYDTTHPKVIALKERIALLNAETGQGKEVNPKGLLVVLSKEKVAATLKDARIRSLGGRSFVVGVEVEGPKITSASFPGKVVWIPLGDVRQMVEVDDEKGK